MAKTRGSVPIEKLLHWAYRDELPKRLMSSAEGIWDCIADYGQRGGVDIGHGAAQRYPHFGLPHPDAERIECAVGALPDADIDWRAEVRAILGDLVALVNLNRRGEQPEPQRKSRVRWGVYDFTIRGKRRRRGAEVVAIDPPRDVMMVKSLHTAAIVTQHARMGTRPDWREEPSRPVMVEPDRGPRNRGKVIGESIGKDRYATGSYCPLRWEPSPISVAEARVDYLVWWRALLRLSRTLELAEFVTLPPDMPEMPWLAPVAPVMILPAGPPSVLWPATSPLPLKPRRAVAGGRKARRLGSAARKIEPESAASV